MSIMALVTEYCMLKPSCQIQDKFGGNQNGTDLLRSIQIGTIATIIAIGQNTEGVRLLFTVERQSAHKMDKRLKSNSI